MQITESMYNILFVVFSFSIAYYIFYLVTQILFSVYN